MRKKNIWLIPRRTCQCHLGRSDQGLLTIQDLRISDDRPKEAFILRLPDELLVKILELAVLRTQPQYSSYERLYSITSIPSLAFTSKRFNRLVLPFLYHTIYFGWPAQIVPPTLEVRTLRRTLQRNPSLGQHCRDFLIHIPSYRFEIRAEDSALVEELTMYLTNLRCLHVDGGFASNRSEFTWGLIRGCVKYMDRLEEIHLNRGASVGLEARTIMRELQSTSLKKLKIHGISAPNHNSALKKPEDLGNANIAELSLSDYHETPQTTAQLLDWPKRLSRLDFDNFCSYTSSYMDLPMFRTMLLKHRESLTTLNIGYLSSSSQGKLLDLSDFTSLEDLKLSRWQMAEALDFRDEDAGMLLSPKLRKFTWDLSNNEQHSESWTGFGETEERWLGRFSQAAVARKASLREIKIVFSPDGWEANEELGYPWDRMDRIKNDFGPLGLAITCNQPPISKEKWLNALKTTRGSLE